LSNKKSLENGVLGVFLTVFSYGRTNYWQESLSLLLNMLEEFLYLKINKISTLSLIFLGSF
jgi:hypothetical protein